MNFEEYLKEGLESYVDTVINKIDPKLRKAYDWDRGRMTIFDKSKIDELIKVLNDSGEFGEATYNKHTNKIEFGVHPRFK